MNTPIKKRPGRQRQARCVCVCDHVCSWCSGCEREKAAGVDRNRECEVLVSTAGKSAERVKMGSIRGTVCSRVCHIFYHSIVTKNSTTMSSVQIWGSLSIGVELMECWMWGQSKGSNEWRNTTFWSSFHNPNTTENHYSVTGLHPQTKLKKEPQDSSHALCLFLGTSVHKLVCPMLQDSNENTLLPCLQRRVSAIQLGARPYSSSNSIRLVWKLLDNWHSLRSTWTARKWVIHSSL